MLLVLDIGNTQVFGGVIHHDQTILSFRRTSRDNGSSDEYGLFLKNALRENNIDPAEIKHIIMASVVPDVNHTVASACIKYFNIRPLILDAGIKTGLKILVHNPKELGADRVANAVGAMMLHPNQNLVIFDFGTANTVCLVNKNKEYLGGLITPGIRLCMEVLEERTAKLPSVEIKIPDTVFGKNTVEQIQAGLYYSVLGMVKEVVAEVRKNSFAGQAFFFICTGGFSRLFEHAGIFDVIESDLVLVGLTHIFHLNKEVSPS
ncbi:MAG: type III pantothenate kinase [Gammaproteobacteria bacterium]|nr:type III pantothenate kinase [Gammaproteobacteria bacterium]